MTGRSDVIERFAVANKLEFEPAPDLPRDGAVLTHAGRSVGSGATGGLPGGGTATLAHFGFTTTDSDDNTTHHNLTVVVTQIPESLAFAPYLAFRGSTSQLMPAIARPGTEQLEFDGAEKDGLHGAKAYRYSGSSDEWLRQLFSPALIDWLARSPDDFGFELNGGVFCAVRTGFLAGDGLDSLWADAGHAATAIRNEAQEAIDSGTAEAVVAKPTKKQEQEAKVVEGAMAAFGDRREVPNIVDAIPTFRRMIVRNPFSWMVILLQSVLITLAINIPGIALPIVLGTQGSWVLLGVIEGLLLLIVFYFKMRSHIRSGATAYAREAFFRTYARERNLTLEEPLKFTAAFAGAKLPFNPGRVISGDWPDGGSGALAILGDGSKRSDRIALVAGPSGPVATEGLDTSPPGLSAKDLDGYAKRLGAELASK